MKKQKKILSLLNESITVVAQQIHNYCTKPDSNFTRNRKLNAETVIRSILSMTDYSLREEINHYWKYSDKSPTKSAFIQQRQKLHPDAFRTLFDEFTNKISAYKRFKGYRLMACDGTAVNLPRNPQDTETSVQARTTASSYNMLHINALYDLMNNIYTDYTIDYGMDVGESAALNEMAKKISDPQKTIIVADRGYGYLTTVYRLSAVGINFVLRCKDITSNSFLTGMAPPVEEFDADISKIMTRHHGKKYSENPEFMIINGRNSLDFKENEFYPVSFRACRFKLPSGGFECLITNLPRSQFPVSVLKQIYHMRWGIETSFRDLKYSVGLMYFHAKKLNSVLQELHAAMLMMNYCSLIVQSIKIVPNSSWIHKHKINFAAAVGCCRSYFSSGEIKQLNLILRDQSPIRPDRRYNRNLHDTKPAKSLAYRVS